MLLQGWIKGIQHHKSVTFLHVNDGSGPQNIQIIIPQSLTQNIDLTFGSCVEIEGVLKESPAAGQNVELLCSSLNILGQCNPNVSVLC
jgi:asparaginyl-tRNA synthetase